MTVAEVSIVGLLVILVAILSRKDVKAGFNFLGLGWFSLEAKDSRRSYAPRQRNLPPKS